MRFQLLIPVLSGLTLVVPAARAEEAHPALEAAPPSVHASGPIEIGVGLGSSQGYGYMGRDLPTLSDIGGAAELTLGWWSNPRWMWGVYGSLGVHAGSGGRSTWSRSVGLHARHSFLAGTHRPWIGFGFGLREHRISRGQGNDSYLGLDLGRFQLGVDSRFGPRAVLSPVLGATLTTFLSYKTPSTGSYTAVVDPKLSVFVFAGLEARLDVL